MSSRKPELMRLYKTFDRLDKKLNKLEKRESRLIAIRTLPQQQIAVEKLLSNPLDDDPTSKYYLFPTYYLVPKYYEDDLKARNLDYYEILGFVSSVKVPPTFPPVPNCPEYRLFETDIVDDSTDGWINYTNSEIFSFQSNSAEVRVNRTNLGLFKERYEEVKPSTYHTTFRIKRGNYRFESYTKINLLLVKV